MAGVKFKVRYIPSAIQKMEKGAQKALVATAEALKTEIVQAQVIPFDTGAMQDNLGVNTKNAKNGEVSLTQTGSYTRRMYFHPEYNFQTKNNANAKGHWFEDWLPGGDQEDFVAETFAKFYKKYSGV